MRHDGHGEHARYRGPVPVRPLTKLAALSLAAGFFLVAVGINPFEAAGAAARWVTDGDRVAGQPINGFKPDHP